jgi:DNA-binding SARP family transcriptional activator/predicted ATPase
MSRLCLYLLGPPRIERDGVSIRVDTRKAIALMAYLAVTKENHRRAALVNLLWPEYDRTRGRAALRRTLSALRKALGDPSADSLRKTQGRLLRQGSLRPRSGRAGQVPSKESSQTRRASWLDVDREHIGLHLGVDPVTTPERAFWLDVDQFHTLLAQCGTHGHPPSEVCPACTAPLTDAVALYRDDFMSGFGLRDSINYDDWQFYQADALRRELIGALSSLTRGYSTRDEFGSAIRYARRWLALDRLDEEAHRQLMQLYAWSGQRSAALRQYQECVRVLESQLGASPQAAVIELHKAILAGRIPPPPSPLVRPVRTARDASAPSRAALASSTAEPGPPVLEGEEKRIVTALFAEASLPLDEELAIGVEDEAGLLDRTFWAMEQVLAGYGARVSRTLGRGLLALFGTEETHENDPELAIRAALDMRKAASDLGLGLAAGIHTGEAYLRWTEREGRRDFAPIGAVVDRAIRLAGGAQVGQILAGEPTYRLTRRAFAFTPIPPDPARDSDPARVYRVDRLLARPEKARGIEGLRAELVGREGELARLGQVLECVYGGSGQMVSLIGEAGVGKSRLVAEVRTHGLTCVGDGHEPLWLEGRCLELGTATSYAPFIDMLREYFAWPARADERSRRERILSSLQQMVDRGDLADDRLEEVGSLLSWLLSVRTEGEGQGYIANETPEHIRHRTFLALRDFVLALTRRQPVVLAFEDLHWADSLSLDLISLLMEALTQGPLLLLCVYRPERGHKCWHLGTIAAQKCRGRYTELYLHELDPHQSHQLVESLLTSEALPHAVKDVLLDRSQGNPFFIEEMVRSLIDSGSVYREGGVWYGRRGIDAAAVPQSVQSVILSRVDHLESDWIHVLQVASAIGRAFRQRVLARAMQADVGLTSALWELQDRALIYEERTVPEVEYSFRHVLTQETIYRSMPQRLRQTIHRRVAEAIEALYADTLQEHCEQLAYHYDSGGQLQEAVVYLLKAGEKAQRSSASQEAVEHLTRALDLVRTLPQSSDRDRKELDVRIALGTALVLTKGHAAPEVESTYARARDLCQEVNEPLQLFQALLGLRRFYYGKGELRTAHELSEQLLDLAQRTADPGLLARAHMMTGETLYRLGEFDAFRVHSEQGAALYDPVQHRSHTFHYGNDTGIGCRFHTAWALWFLGYPSQALAASRAGLARARELSHAFTLAFALYHAGFVHLLRREDEAVRELAGALTQLAAERGFALYSAWGTLLLGWALTAGGQLERGIMQMRNGLTSWRATGAGMGIAVALAFLADAYARGGHAEEGLCALNEALVLAEGQGERCWEAELYRLKGELLLIRGKAADSAEAEAHFHRALAVAREQGARSWELRAATCLCRLWHRQDKIEPVGKLLQRTYSWFTEGHDTADLREAAALIDVLGEDL